MNDNAERPTLPLSEPPEPAPRRMSGMFWLLLVLLGLLVLPYLAEQVQFAITRGRQRAGAEVARERLDQLPDGVGVYRLVAKSIAPCVVGVETENLLGGGRQRDEYSHLFRQPHIRARGEGSGVIVDKAGYIITNFHVLNRATKVTVSLSDGREIHDVKIIGADPLSDVAVLKIEAEGLTAAPWGNSDQLEVGDPVLAVGNPFGLDRTVTAGIVSAKGRRRVVDNLDYQDFLQTDAAVNPGNSGGPLVNMKGQVVGINTAIVGRAYQGISFAIPSRLARDVYERLKTTGKVARGWLGVAMQELDEPLARRLGLDKPRGALVSGVVSDSPAARAGIEPGDVVVKLNGKEIDDPTDLSLAVARTKIGSEATVTLLRDGKQLEIKLTVAERPAMLKR